MIQISPFVVRAARPHQDSEKTLRGEVAVMHGYKITLKMIQYRLEHRGKVQHNQGRYSNGRRDFGVGSNLIFE